MSESEREIQNSLSKDTGHNKVMMDLQQLLVLWVAILATTTTTVTAAVATPPPPTPLVKNISIVAPATNGVYQ